jgi:hypothetical protein
MKLTIIHPAITSIVLDKEGPLQEKTLETIERVALNISEKINNGTVENINLKEVNEEIKNSMISSNLNRLKWILIGGGPLFFFIRAIYLASTGGDCFGTINPICSWILLISEIFISGVAGISGIIGLIFWKKDKNRLFNLGRINLRQSILLTGICAYSMHFIRVAIWIILCVI